MTGNGSLKPVIKILTGIPSIIPAGAIAIFDIAEKLSNKRLGKALQLQDKNGRSVLMYLAQYGPEYVKALYNVLCKKTFLRKDKYVNLFFDQDARKMTVLMYLAQQTAEASKEGGFLGIGAVRVSDKEQAALDELAEVLGVSAA